MICILGGILVSFVISPNETLSFMLFSIGMIMLCLMILFFAVFMIFLEFASGRRQILHLMFAGLLNGILVGLILSSEMMGIKHLDFPAITYISLQWPVFAVGGIIILYVLILFVTVFGHNMRNNKGVVLEKKFLYLTIGLLIHVLSFFICMMLGGLAKLNAIGLFFTFPSFIGLLIFIKGLSLHPQYLIYLKEKVSRLIVFRQGGEVLYIYRFRRFPRGRDVHYFSSR